MNILNKIKSSIFIILALCFFAVHTTAQNASEDCFEIKYLDFFGLDEIKEINWSDEEISELLGTDFSEKYDDTRFLIPFTVRYLKDFHPDCNNAIDMKRFNKLVALYFKVRLKDISPIENKSIEEKLNFIRQDFYNLVQDERLLPRMKYTMDDGPLYGEIPKSMPKSKTSESIITDFGKLSIIESNNQIFLVAADKENKTIWSRIVKGTSPDRYLRNLKFDKEPVEKTSLATIIHFYSEGERLNLYLKLDGKFMYYYHSW